MLGLLRAYRRTIALLVVLGLLGNGAGLFLPALIGQGINAFSGGEAIHPVLWREFAAIIVVVAWVGFWQNVLQVRISETVARDLRSSLCDKISRQSYTFVMTRDPARLLTNMTSDVDAVKLFVSQVIPNLLSSAVVLLGASFMLVHLNWRLGLTVLTILPAIALTFYAVLRRVKPLFSQSRAVVDRVNKIIQQTIGGSALIRVLDAHDEERAKFAEVNDRAMGLGLTILKNFAMMIPAVTFFANSGTMMILALGGWLVLKGSLELGDIAAFNSYLALLIFPIFVIGFMSNLVSQAQVAFQRLQEVLNAAEAPVVEPVGEGLRGEVQVRDVVLERGDRTILKGVSLHLEPGSRNAIVGPTAAGKSQLLMLLCGLLSPDSGEILYDGSYKPEQLKRQVGVVFQESALFQGTLGENIALHPDLDKGALDTAMRSAELADFVEALPLGLDTPVSERGTTLSGGQKQRVMLARALALQPDVLLLDDVTARLDPATEARVQANLRENYPRTTVLAVTQRIATIKDYDRIFLMMEGDMLASGSHSELLASSPEYAQIYDSQKSTHQYE